MKKVEKILFLDSTAPATARPDVTFTPAWLRAKSGYLH
jgi:hypothetical protein